MQRRKFNLLGATSLLALATGKAKAATATQAASLQTTLTPFGAERAANADGSIPAWTGGMTEMPAGVVAGQGVMPDFYAADQKITSINAGNMAQHTDRLAPGLIELMQKFADFRIDVYPSHRPASAPQWVYDNTAKNAVTATVNTTSPRLGFYNAYGGIPFPIPDADPAIAGAQIMFNHETRWLGSNITRTSKNEVVQGTSVTLAGGFTNHYRFCYYDPAGNYASWNKFLFWDYLPFIAPPASLSEQIVSYYGTNPLEVPTENWIYLAGR